MPQNQAELCKVQTYHFRRIKVNDIELILKSVVLIPSEQNSSEVTDAVQSEVTGGRRPCSLNGRRQPELYWEEKYIMVAINPANCYIHAAYLS